MKQKRYGAAEFDSLCERALASKRLRVHENIHDELEDPCQRLLIAMARGSFVRPHRHLQHPKAECFVALRGTIGLVVFDDAGETLQFDVVAPGDALAVAELPPGTWHTLIALDPVVVFMEVKRGPYVPISGPDFAPWAPAEGAPEAAGYLRQLENRFGPVD